MSFLEKIKKFFNRLFFRRLDSSTINNVIENKRDYKKLKFVNEIYVEPNIHDGTGFKKKTNH